MYSSTYHGYSSPCTSGFTSEYSEKQQDCCSKFLIAQSTVPPSRTKLAFTHSPTTPTMALRQTTTLVVASSAAVFLMAGGQPISAVTNLGHPNGDLKCDVCKPIAEGIVNLGENATQVEKVIEELKDQCAKWTKNHSSIERIVCDDLTKGLVELVPLLDNKLIDALAWDADNLCAIAGVCKENCCIGKTPTDPEQVGK